MKALSLLVVTVLVLAAGTAAAAAAQEGPQTVVVMPFNALGTSDGTNGIGVGTQQVLLAELGRLNAVHPVAGTAGGPWPVTIESAAKAAKDAGANYVIYGSYHLHERDLRIMGQVLDLRSNRFVGGLKATGAARDLFAVQDVIVRQARRIIQERLAPPTTADVEPESPVVEEPAEQLIEPLGAVRAVPAWEDPDPVVARARQRIANQDDYDRVTYAYRNTYGFAPLYGFNFGYTYPYYPRVYYRYRGHHHRHHHHHR